MMTSLIPAYVGLMQHINMILVVTLFFSLLMVSTIPSGYVICPDTIPKWCPQSFNSCYDILQTYSTAPSGYYIITLSNGSRIEEYCDMKGSHCDGEGSWTGVAFVNKSEPGSSCPPGLVQYNISDIILCWINHNYIGCNIIRLVISIIQVVL